MIFWVVTLLYIAKMASTLNLSRVVYIPHVALEVELTDIEEQVKKYGTISDKIFVEPPGATMKCAYFVFANPACVNALLSGEVSTTIKVGDSDLIVKRVSGFHKYELSEAFPTMFPPEETDIDTIMSLLDNMPGQQRRSTLNHLSILAGAGDGVPSGTGTSTQNTASGSAGVPAGGSFAVSNSTRVSHGGRADLFPGASITVENPPQLPRRLRLFSGKSPTPNGEVEYEDWRLCAKNMIENTTDEAAKKRCLMDSLLRPALSLVSHMGGAPASTIFDELELIYGKVHDKFGIMATVHGTLMNRSEKPSQYLQRIYTVVTEAADCGAIDRGDIVKNTIAQFRLGLLNEPLGVTLRLHELEQNPPPFAKLMQSVRREEALQANRDAHRAKTAKVHQVAATSDSPDKTTSGDCVSLLQQQVTAQSKELEQLRAQMRSHSGKKEKKEKKKSSFKGFCYNCGKDNHKSDQCTGASNPEYVQQRLQSRKAKKEQSN